MGSVAGRESKGNIAGVVQVNGKQVRSHVQQVVPTLCETFRNSIPISDTSASAIALL